MNAPLPASVLAEPRAAGELPPDPEVLADCARAYEAKLSRLQEQLDPSWRRALEKKWPLLTQLDDPLLVARCVLRLVYGHAPPRPPLLRLTDPVAQLVLRDRVEVMRSLCALALARRPGVLRCCIDRQARDALRGALGDSFETMKRLSASGRAVPDEQTSFTPLHWACVGYTDWCSLMRPDDRALRRIVRLSLPRPILVALVQRGAVSAESGAAKGLSRLQEAGVGWAC